MRFVSRTMGRSALSEASWPREPGRMHTVDMAPRLVQLRWADRCSSCDRRLLEGTEVEWDPRARLVTCRACSSGDVVEPAVASIWTATQPTAADPDLRIDLSNRLESGSRGPDRSIEFHWKLPDVHIAS
jgi:hypothetical protein